MQAGTVGMVLNQGDDCFRDGLTEYYLRGADDANLLGTSVSNTV